MRRHRQVIIAGAAGLLALGLTVHPTANVRILTHDIGDPTPRRVQAAVDLGVVGLNVLVTWTAHHLTR